MKIKQLAGVVVCTAAMFSVGAVAPAWAINNIKGFGVQETLKDFYSLSNFSSEIGYTVKNLRPSRDAVPYPVAGRLYEANVSTAAVVGTVIPQIQQLRCAQLERHRLPGAVERLHPQRRSAGSGGQRVGQAVLRRRGREPRQRGLPQQFRGLAWLGRPTARRAGGSGSRDREQHRIVAGRTLVERPGHRGSGFDGLPTSPPRRPSATVRRTVRTDRRAVPRPWAATTAVSSTVSTDGRQPRSLRSASNATRSPRYSDRTTSIGRSSPYRATAG